MAEASREIVGLFHDATALEDAANALMSNGFDRSALSLIATEEVVRKELGARAANVEALEDNPDTPRIAYADSDDLAVGRGAVIGGLAYVGAIAGTAAVLMSGGALLPAVAAAVAGGAGAGGIGALFSSWLTTATADKISGEIDRGGLILWVRTHSQEDDDRALAIMKDHGAYDVHAHAGSGETPAG